MFDVFNALRKYNGIEPMNSIDLRKLLEKIILENYKDIPVEFRARDFFDLAINNGWIKENQKTGLYKIWVTRKIKKQKSVCSECKRPLS